jgi:hypothetical protein
MLYVICSVKDRAIEAFQPTFCVRAEGQAIRGFQDALNNPEAAESKHPDDYDLYVVGYFEDQTGTINYGPDRQGDLPRKIADGKQLRLTK